jgi:N-glycosylase/DNA lyase
MDGGAETIRYPQQMVPRITIKEVLMIHTEEDPTSKVVDMLLEGLAVTKSFCQHNMAAILVTKIYMCSYVIAVGVLGLGKFA